ncbi:glycoside hydrolase family 9 protein [Ekhidna sp.]
MRIAVLVSLLTGLNWVIYAQDGLKINELDYFEMPGLNVTVFSDIYPDGHQTGVTIIQHGVRTAANGDLRLEASPGQWSPIPKGGNLSVDKIENTISQELWYPDSSKNRKGFNPIIYPDLQLKYSVSVTPTEGSSFKVEVHLDEPIPDEWHGKIGFNFELFPQHLFGKSYLMDEQVGLFPIQPNGPLNPQNEQIALPLATGKKLTVAPEENLQRLTITSESELELWDGRTNHNNGWFIVRSVIPKGKAKNALEWVITPNVVKDWTYKPAIHVSQVGYHTKQKKKVLLETGKTINEATNLTLYRITDSGKEEVASVIPKVWGQFLRYNYFEWDFSNIEKTGIYQFAYDSIKSNPFQISDDIFERHVWQPTLEYFLPVQMCHMRVNEKYRVWHGLCHMDDALMAPLDTNHFDGYVQGSSTLTSFKPLERVEKLNVGGWHDAGDYDLRVESQIGTVWNLALMVEEFGLNYDATLIDQEKHIVEIHTPDGKSDALQQIEHGLISILGATRSMDRLYRGIICSDIRQYTLLGDASVMTDNIPYSKESGLPLDDRLVFTEDNPDREMYVIAGLAASARVLEESNPELSKECLETALKLYNRAKSKAKTPSKVLALSELIITTKDQSLIKEFVSLQDDIVKNIDKSGWVIGRAMSFITDKKFKKTIYSAVQNYQNRLNEEAKESPFGVPYKPNIWGAGWSIQQFGKEQYFFHKTWPELTTSDFFINSFNFVLGVHPGENTMSFVSGVGSKSATVAYGVNRADWSFIPGGSISGTALIKPDLPELKIWPYFWQQTEYVMGGGATNYMFLALAVKEHFKE